MPWTLRITVHMSCTLSRLVSSEISYNCLTHFASYSSFAWRCSFDHSTMTFNWSFTNSIVYQMMSTVFVICPSCFILLPLKAFIPLLDRPYCVPITLSGDMFNPWLYIIGISRSLASLAGNSSNPLGKFDPTLAKVSARAPVARSFPKT